MRPRLDLALAGSLIVLGLPLFMSDIIGMVTLRLDTIALSIFSTPTEIGYYGVANKLREVAVKLPYMFAAFLMPLLVRSLGDLREFNLRLSNSLVAVWVFAVSVMLAMGCFGDVILQLLAGRDFAESATVVQIRASRSPPGRWPRFCKWAPSPGINPGRFSMRTSSLR